MALAIRRPVAVAMSRIPRSDWVVAEGQIFLLPSADAIVSAIGDRPW